LLWIQRVQLDCVPAEVTIHHWTIEFRNSSTPSRPIGGIPACLTGTCNTGRGSASLLQNLQNLHENLQNGHVFLEYLIK
jgi:hypothetical protein